MSEHKQAVSAAYSDSKPHYDILDGLRGVAALVVVWFHVFEAFATSPLDQRVNHGYLAVDFFFILSGFVVGYAYDDRWGKMTVGAFFRRRLVRLHPMVVAGLVLGVVTFLLQGCTRWDGTEVALGAVLVAALFNLFMLPVWPGAYGEVRGNGEMYPLNGPCWSLFFEYVGNIFYALVVRRLSTKWLVTLVAVLGAVLVGFLMTNASGYYNIGVGWTLAGNNLPGGLIRMAFPFTVGLLLSRVFRPVKVRGAFWLCSLVIIALLNVPYVGGEERMWLNGLYETVCIVVIFPALVWLGASGRMTDSKSAAVCRFLGNISYPLYIIHYPFMYLYFHYTWSNGLSFADVWPVALCVFIGSILLAWVLLKVYDEPVRKWLARRFLHR